MASHFLSGLLGTPRFSKTKSDYDMRTNLRADYMLQGEHKTAQVSVARREEVDDPVAMERAQQQLIREMAQDARRVMEQQAAQQMQAINPFPVGQGLGQIGGAMAPGMPTMTNPYVDNNEWYLANDQAMRWTSATGSTTTNTDYATATSATMNMYQDQMYQNVQRGWQEHPQQYDAVWNNEITIEFQDGKRTLKIKKPYGENPGGPIQITEADIQEARVQWWKESRITVLKRKAETKAEDLLQMFISDIDFRNYKQKGYFTVKVGDRVYRIHKDSHKWIDVWKKGRGEAFKGEKSLCVHTPRREIASADEALAKLMLIRSGRAFEDSNPHGFCGDENSIEIPELVKEKELVLV